MATDTATQRSWIRTIYLYLLAMIGIILIVVGGVRLLDMGLKAFVFRQAEEEERTLAMQPPLPFHLERVERLGRGEEALAPEEAAAVRQWLEDYRQWKERTERIDPLVARRQRTASTSLSLILVGLPLYLYHWGIIRREGRGREASP